MRRCVEQLGMIGVHVPPSLPVPHPAAPARVPAWSGCRSTSRIPTSRPILAEAERLDVALGVHGSPGVYLPCGIAEQVDTFILSHIFGHRNQMQMALAACVFDGVFDRHPRPCAWASSRRAAAGCPTSCTPSTSTGRSASATSIPTCSSRWASSRRELLRERGGKDGKLNLLGKASGIYDLLARVERERRDHDARRVHRSSIASLDHDPTDFFRRGQIFVSFESDDPAPAYLREALGAMGEDLACFSADYGHWDGVLTRLREERRARCVRTGATTSRSSSPATACASMARVCRPRSGSRPARPPRRADVMPETSLFAANEVHVGQDVGGRTFSITRDAIERYRRGTRERRRHARLRAGAPSSLRGVPRPFVVPAEHHRQPARASGVGALPPAARRRRRCSSRVDRRRALPQAQSPLRRRRGRPHRRSRPLAPAQPHAPELPRRRPRRRDGRRQAIARSGPSVASSSRWETASGSRSRRAGSPHPMCEAFSGPQKNYHTDREMARALGFPDIVVQGMMSVCFVADLMTKRFGRRVPGRRQARRAARERRLAEGRRHAARHGARGRRRRVASARTARRLVHEARRHGDDHRDGERDRAALKRAGRPFARNALARYTRRGAAAARSDPSPHRRASRRAGARRARAYPRTTSSSRSTRREYASAFHRIVEMAAPPPSLEATEAAALVARAPRDAVRMTVRLVDAGGRVVHRTVAETSREIRGEFHGADEIDGHHIPRAGGALRRSRPRQSTGRGSRSTGRLAAIGSR